MSCNTGTRYQFRQKYILTPPSREKAKIKSRTFFGATSNNTFLHTIRATGKQGKSQMTFSSSNLPKGFFMKHINPHWIEVL